MESRSRDVDREKYIAGLQTTSDQMRNINEKQEKLARYHHTRAQTLSIYNLLYQIILYASVATSSSVRCDQRWIPLSLSLIPALLYFAALLSALTSYDNIKRQLDTYYIEMQRIRGLIHDAESKTDVVLRIDDDGHVMGHDGFVDFKRRFCIWSTVLAMGCFNVVVLVSPMCLLCRRLEEIVEDYATCMYK